MLHMAIVGSTIHLKEFGFSEFCCKETECIVHISWCQIIKSVLMLFVFTVCELIICNIQQSQKRSEFTRYYR
jgi:hypothetical protein